MLFYGQLWSVVDEIGRKLKEMLLRKGADKAFNRKTEGTRVVWVYVFS